MSHRLALLNLGLRLVGRPGLAAIPVTKQSDAAIARIVGVILPRPRGLQHSVVPGTPTIHRISVGTPMPGRVVLHFHGGAYVSGSPLNRRGMLGRLSALSGCEVVAPVYRLAPTHTAPAQFDDALAAHEWLLQAGHAPQDIVLGGDSAGGGLALALLADLCRRNLRPAAFYAISPWTDLTLSGGSLQTNAGRDPFLPAPRITEIARLVLGDLAATDPRISPLFAAFDAPPPVQLHVGCNEILRDDSRRMATHLRAAGGDVTLREVPQVPHIWPIFDGFIPEARATLAEIAAFVQSAPR